MLPASLLSLVLSFLAARSVHASTAAETYTETLRITPLPDGKVHSAFDFTMRGPWEEEGVGVGKNAVAHHHSLVPPALTAVLLHYRVATFSVTLSSGRWSPTWPLHAPPNAVPTAPASGIELFAWLELLEDESEAEEQRRWEGFKGAIGGLFCAGIVNTGGESRPTWGYSFDGEGAANEHRLYRTLLPRLSATCTESLTPFLSLLPCSSHAGLSSLLNPHVLFDGDWTLIGMHFRREAGEGMVRLEVGSVGDPIRKNRLAGGLGRRDFSMESLYDRKISKGCPVASTSEVTLVIPNDSPSPFTIEPAHGWNSFSRGGQDLAVWDTKTLPDGPIDVAIKWENEQQYRYPDPAKLPLLPISSRRLLYGHGQERGEIGIEVTNSLYDVAEVIWVEQWPWWVRAFVGSLEEKTMPSGATFSLNHSTPMVVDFSYTPPIARKRPTTLQALLRLPPRSTSRFLLRYESSYLWYTEYPSDAHRGFEVPGALLVLLQPPSASSHPSMSPSHTPRSPNYLFDRGQLLRLHTASTLLSLPTPDFSMPYNVIILTSTVIALFFGSVMNPLVRTWMVVDLDIEGEEEVDSK